MGWTVYPTEPEKWAPWAYFSPSEHGTVTAYSSEECDQFVLLAEKQAAEAGQLVDGSVVEDIRRVAVHKLLAEGDIIPLFDKLMAAIISANRSYWNFQIQYLPLIEVLKYETNGHYLRHVDWGAGFQTRKISAVVMLSEPEEYEGGILQLHDRGLPTDMPRERGTIIVFPSWVLHGVTPVTDGVRWAATAWVTGEPFR